MRNFVLQASDWTVLVVGFLDLWGWLLYVAQRQPDSSPYRKDLKQTPSRERLVSTPFTLSGRLRSIISSKGNAIKGRALQAQPNLGPRTPGAIQLMVASSRATQRRASHSMCKRHQGPRPVSFARFSANVTNAAPQFKSRADQEQCNQGRRVFQSA